MRKIRHSTRPTPTWFFAGTKNESPHTTITDHASNAEAGQVVILMAAILGIFLLAILGFAVDYTKLWFDHQRAQAAADSACMAGAMDLYFTASGITLPKQNFTVGTAGSCTGVTPTPTMCTYAAFNGYNSNGGAHGNTVSYTFPNSISGVSAPAGVTYPFLQVTIVDNPQLFLAPMAGAGKYTTVGVTSSCGVVAILGIPPLVVLNPTDSSTLSISGSSAVTILGGGSRSIEVNSGNATAIYSGTIDLSQAGPNFTGADLGVLGGPSSPPSGFNGGTTGSWISPAVPVIDPYASVPVPSSVINSTASQPAILSVNYHVDGCPDSNGCAEYFPGKYISTICVKNTTAIFNPGVYVINPPSTAKKCADGSNLPGAAGNAAFYVDANGEVRMATRSDRRTGVMFYVYGAVNFDANSGKRVLDGVPPTDLTCDGSAPDSHLGMTSNLNGNILLGMCTTDGWYVDSGNDTSDTLDSNGHRGLAFFQNRASSGLTSYFGGNGSYAFAGSFYMHSTDFSSHFALQGTSGASAFVIGEIVTDYLALGGTGNVKMLLNGTKNSPYNRVALLQ